MPYTKQELENVDFYQDFINRLRQSYLDNMEELSETNFRKDGVLYSFEDIFHIDWEGEVSISILFYLVSQN